ncbi:MAG: hypothetical protein ABF633_03230 [Clostridium sp.]|uniref:hypothetical protein n=1 Tax=Clostridium sp. TaxID=1506 RepID=UPI0039EB53C0
MTDERFALITAYITDNIYHSEQWNEATEALRKKAVNNSAATLLNVLKKYYTVEADIPDDVIAHQTIWFMRIDDTFLRAEMGVTYIQMSGLMITIKDKDRSIAPYVLDALKITPDALTGGVSRRKVGSYSGRTIGTPDSLMRREQ